MFETGICPAFEAVEFSSNPFGGCLMTSWELRVLWPGRKHRLWSPGPLFGGLWKGVCVTAWNRLRFSPAVCPLPQFARRS